MKLEIDVLCSEKQIDEAVAKTVKDLDHAGVMYEDYDMKEFTKMVLFTLGLYDPSNSEVESEKK